MMTENETKAWNLGVALLNKLRFIQVVAFFILLLLLVQSCGSCSCIPWGNGVQTSAPVPATAVLVTPEVGSG